MTKQFKPEDLPLDYTKLKPIERKHVRELYMEQQKNLCWFCNQSLLFGIFPNNPVNKFQVNKLLFPAGFFNNPIHLHHSHENHMTIGAVHAHCNAVLWQHLGE